MQISEVSKRPLPTDLMHAEGLYPHPGPVKKTAEAAARKCSLEDDEEDDDEDAEGDQRGR